MNIIYVTGPAGSGKTKLVADLINDCPMGRKMAAMAPEGTTLWEYERELAAAGAFTQAVDILRELPKDGYEVVIVELATLKASDAA